MSQVDGLRRAYYGQAFELKYRAARGVEFQSFFATLMELRYPNDFSRTRPWGNTGDEKCDGYLPSRRFLFQCYAPDRWTEAKAKKKMSDDFAGALPHWKEHFSTWVFTHNDPDGLSPGLVKHLQGLPAENRGLSAVQWGLTQLKVEFAEVPDEVHHVLLGPAPGIEDVVNLQIRDVRYLLEHIELQPPVRDEEVSPVPPGKVQHNQLSPDAARLLQVGMSRAELVRRYLRGLIDQTRYDRVVASFRGEYKRLREEGLGPDQIFQRLLAFVLGPLLPQTPQRQAAGLAILAHLFEICEIFERPPVVSMS